MSRKSIDVMVPQNVQAEEAVLGSLLIDPMAAVTVRAVLDPGDFYLQKHAWVYEALLDAAKAEALDPLTVADGLERRGHFDDIGGMAYLNGLITATPSSINARRYAEIVRDMATRRRLIDSASEIARMAYDTDADLLDVIGRAEGAVMAARRERHGDMLDAADLTAAFYEEVQAYRRNGKDGMHGIPTGVDALDQALHGIEPGLYYIAARPSMGKTALLCQIAAHMAKQGKRVLLFTIEMSGPQLMARMATSEARVELEELKRNRAEAGDYVRLIDALGPIADWPLSVVDMAPLRPSDVLAKLREVEMRHGDVDAVFIDGLWLMRPQSRENDRRLEVGSISRDMKQIQRNLGIPVWITHQLNRSCEGRSDKRPLLSDLRETGDVEQDLDVCLMLYREGYYNPEHIEANVAEIICRKNRLGGEAGWAAKTYWRGEYMRFEPLQQGVNL